MSEFNKHPFTWEYHEDGTVITLVEQITSNSDGSVSSEDLEAAMNSIGLQKDASGLVYTLMVNGSEAGTINIPEDQFLKNVDYNKEEKKLIFTFNVENENGEKSVEVDVKDLVDIYSVGNGLFVDDEQKISIIISPNTQKYIEVDADGIRIVGIDEALALKADKTDLEGLASEKWVEEKNYLTEVPETWATDEELKEAVSSKAEASSLEVYLLKEEAKTIYQEKGDFALKAEIPSKASQLENDIPYLTEHQDVSMLATSEELIAEIGRATAKENEIESGYKATDEVIMTELSKKVAEVELEKVNDLQYQLLVDGNVVGSVNIPEDQFLKSVEYAAASNELVFVFKTENGENTVSVNIADLVDTYTAGNGLEVSENKFEIAIDPSTESYLSVSENGLKVIGIDEALAEKENVGVAYSKVESDAKFLVEHQDISHLSSKEELKVESDRAIAKEAEIEAALKLKADVENVYTKEESDNKFLTEHQDISNFVTKEEQTKEISILMETIKTLEERIVKLERRVFNASEMVEIISNLNEGEEKTIELYNNLTVSSEEPIIIPEGSTLNINLNGNTINYMDEDILFRVNGTLNISNGKVDASGYVASANAGGTVNVFDGEYKTDVTCLQCNGGTVNIYGGLFDSYTEQYGRVYTLNHIDSQKNNGIISVTGGTFVGYDPSNSYSENPPMNFVADGYESVPVVIDGVECFTVVKKSEVSTSEEVVEAISNVAPGEVVALNVTSDIEMTNAESVEISEGATVSLNLNGHKLSNPVSEHAAIVNKGELIIVDGDFVNENKDAQGADVISNEGYLTINGGNIGSLKNRGAAVRNYGTCTINGGNFLSMEKGVTNDDGFAYVFINQSDDAVMTINDAHVEGNVHGVFGCISGTMNVNGGYYKIGENGKQTFYIAYVGSKGIVNLNGGEYYWTKGAANVSTYVVEGGSLNMAEGVVINETR